MGAEQSVRETHFQAPSQPEPPPKDIPDEHLISISNKMVERLVEDATVNGGAATSRGDPWPPRSDYKDKIYMEKLSSLDDKHSERLGLTVEELGATARRIEIRTANMLSVEPVCADCKEQVIECYNTTDSVNCWNTVGAFAQCVRNAATARLKARTQKEERDIARRTRHVAHAREHALRDLATPVNEGGDSS